MLLIYVEDPGAANFIAQIPQTLVAHGVDCTLLTDGLATSYLQNRGVCGREVKAGDSAEKLIKELKPQLVLVGTSENPKSLGLKLISQAKKEGVPTVGVIDLEVNADRRFAGESNSPMQHAPDWVLVPDASAKSAYESLGFDPTHVLACGHPHYDYVREIGSKLQTKREALRKQVLEADGHTRDTVPIIVFVAEPASQMNPELSLRSAEYTLQGRGDSDKRTEIVLQELLDALGRSGECKGAQPFLVLRLHPKNKEEEFTAYKKEINSISTDGDPLELVAAADLVVGMSSMLLQEAALMGMQTLSVLPRSAEKNWLPAIKLGVIPAVTTREELQQALDHWAKNWKKQGVVQSANAETIAAAFPSGSLDKVVQFILQDQFLPAVRK
jgi:hypothetical protein